MSKGPPAAASKTQWGSASRAGLYQALWSLGTHLHCCSSLLPRPPGLFRPQEKQNHSWQTGLCRCAHKQCFCTLSTLEVPIWSHVSLVRSVQSLFLKIRLRRGSQLCNFINIFTLSSSVWFPVVPARSVAEIALATCLSEDLFQCHLLGIIYLALQESVIVTEISIWEGSWIKISFCHTLYSLSTADVFKLSARVVSWDKNVLLPSTALGSPAWAWISTRPQRREPAPSQLRFECTENQKGNCSGQRWHFTAWQLGSEHADAAPLSYCGQQSGWSVTATTTGQLDTEEGSYRILRAHRE